MKKIMIWDLLAFSQTNCAWRSVPKPEDWFVESYSFGILTVQHEGREYMATCEFGTTFNPTNNRGSDWQYSPDQCDIAIGLVKREVQAFGGRKKDENGRIVNMWTVGDTLALRSWENERSPWQQEHFKVTSVTDLSTIGFQAHRGAWPDGVRYYAHSIER